MSGPTKFVFDTNAALVGIKAATSVEEASVNLSGSLPFISVIVRMELLAKPGLQPDELAKIGAFLDSVTVVPLTEEIEEEAIAIRRDAKLKLPDAIVAATAVKLGAILLTNDREFTKKPISALTVRSLI
ncbi:motility twitching protein PilT [Campylobacterota bacterium]|nr:motility twitching protein PilT [Campylobacterota bacterium]